MICGGSDGGGRVRVGCQWRSGGWLLCMRRRVGSNGKGHLLEKVVHVGTPEERDNVKGLEKDKQRLESALAQSQLKVLALEELIRLAEQMYKVDFKKNSGSGSSKGSEV